MRLPLLLLGLFFSAVLSLSARAETYDTPDGLLTALYAPYLQDISVDVYTPFFSDRLNGLYAADAAKTPEGEIGALDFDPVIAGQDFKITHLQIGKPKILGEAADVTVKFDNMDDPVVLYYSLVEENGGWKVDDIELKGGDFPWKLSALFEETSE